MTTEFEKIILNSIRGYAGLVTKLAKGFSESSRVRNTIKSTVEKKSDGTYIIKTTAGNPVTAPDARAREFGSGLHARRGAKRKYIIKPVNAKALVFPWEKAHPSIPRTRDDRVILSKVEHPGIEADNNGKGYIAPASIEARKVLKERLKKEGAEGIKVEINKALRAGNFKVR